jgi:hypothetical protein
MIISNDLVLLIEDSQNPTVVNLELRLAKLICDANQLQPMIILNESVGFQTAAVAHKYGLDFKILTRVPLARTESLKLFLIAIIKLFAGFTRRRVKKLSYQRYLIGNIIYDSYLSQWAQSTVKPFSIKLLISIYRTLRELESSHKLIEKAQPTLLLLTHRIGVRGGSMALVAENLRIPIVTFGGYEFVTILKSHLQNANEVHPTSNELQQLRNISDSELNLHFEIAKEGHLGNSINADSKFAFSGRVLTGRTEFLKFHNLSEREKRPVIYILAHVFNDYPNSHYPTDEFADYFDWLQFTLKMASKNKKVLWVVREHPSSKMYQLSEDTFGQLRNRYECENIIFQRSGDAFSLTTLSGLAAAIVTFRGSAGYEVPALFGIPSISFSSGPYQEFNVGLSFHKRSDYGDFLLYTNGDISISAEQISEAKRYYVYNLLLIRRRLRVAPPFSHDEAKNWESNPVEFIEAAIEFVQELGNLDEFLEIESLISKPEFTNLFSTDLR